MYNFKDAYLNKSKRKTSDEVLKKTIMHPALMRKLVSLLEDKVKLDSIAENPWFDDMQSAEITADDVKNAKDFVNFCIREDAKKQMAYRTYSY